MNCELESVKTIIDVLVAIGTGLTAFFTYLAARATRDSAIQATISAEVAQKTLEVAERPWVGVTATGYTIKHSNRPHFFFELENHGSLPAYLIGYRINSCVSERDPPAEPRFATQMKGAATLNPGEKRRFELPSEGTISGEDNNRVRTGQARSFVWFEFNYRDPLQKDHYFAGILGAETVNGT
jgi:hypothetical protein